MFSVDLPPESLQFHEDNTVVVCHQPEGVCVELTRLVNPHKLTEYRFKILSHPELIQIGLIFRGRQSNFESSFFYDLSEGNITHRIKTMKHSEVVKFNPPQEFEDRDYGGDRIYKSLEIVGFKIDQGKVTFLHTGQTLGEAINV